MMAHDDGMPDIFSNSPYYSNEDAINLLIPK